jgi:hypothetical protein
MIRTGGAEAMMIIGARGGAANSCHVKKKFDRQI